MVPIAESASTPRAERATSVRAEHIKLVVLLAVALAMGVVPVQLLPEGRLHLW